VVMMTIRRILIFFTYNNKQYSAFNAPVSVDKRDGSPVCTGSKQIINIGLSNVRRQ